MKEFTHLFGLGSDCTPLFITEKFDTKYLPDFRLSPSFNSCIPYLTNFVDTICDRNAAVLEYNDIVLAPQRLWTHPAVVNIKTGQAFIHHWFDHSRHTLGEINMQIPNVRVELVKRFNYLRSVLDDANNRVLFIYVGDGEVTARKYGCHLVYHRNWFSLEEARYCIDALRSSFSADINLLYLNIKNDGSHNFELEYIDDHLVAMSHAVMMGKAVKARSDLLCSKFYKDWKRIYGQNYFSIFDSVKDDNILATCYHPHWDCHSDILCLDLKESSGYGIASGSSFSVQSYEENCFTVGWKKWGSERFVLSTIDYFPVYIAQEH